MAEVIYELYTEIATNHTICHILRISRTGRANKCSILISNIIHTNLNLSTIVTEKLLTEIEVTQNIVLVILVGKAEILHIRARGGEGKALPELPFKSTRCRVVEVVVLTIARRSGIPRLVECSVPRYGEVQLLRNVATQCNRCIVTDVICIVGRILVVQHILQRAIHS